MYTIVLYSSQYNQIHRSVRINNVFGPCAESPAYAPFRGRHRCTPTIPATRFDVGNPPRLHPVHGFRHLIEAYVGCPFSTSSRIQNFGLSLLRPARPTRGKATIHTSLTPLTRTQGLFVFVHRRHADSRPSRTDPTSSLWRFKPRYTHWLVLVRHLQLNGSSSLSPSHFKSKAFTRSMTACGSSSPSKISMLSSDWMMLPLMTRRGTGDRADSPEVSSCSEIATRGRTGAAWPDREVEIALRGGLCAVPSSARPSTALLVVVAEAGRS